MATKSPSPLPRLPAGGRGQRLQRSVGCQSAGQGHGQPNRTSTTQQVTTKCGPTAATVQANELIIGVIGRKKQRMQEWASGRTVLPRTPGQDLGRQLRVGVSLGYQIVSAIGQFTAAKIVANNHTGLRHRDFKAGAGPTRVRRSCLPGRYCSRTDILCRFHRHTERALHNRVCR